MGVYDTVLISEEYDLPKFKGDDCSDHEWQTKDLENFLKTYKIQDDKLFKKKTEKETKEEWEEFFEKNDIENHLELINKDIEHPPLPVKKITNTEWVEQNQHGSFQFYKTIDNYYYVYEARFTNGQLDDIILIQRKDKNKKI